MRRRLFPVASIVCLALLAGCGDDDKSSNATTDSTALASSPDVTNSAATISAATIPAECAASAATDPVDTTPDESAPVGSFPEGKPTVEIPDASPTELVVTDLIEGSGEGAKAGDTVVVNYIGVLTSDGTEFDNSYDSGSTFPVVLGAGRVIPGWDQGLEGIKVGGRRQLDIPAELAYGDAGSGDIIKPGDAISFIVDAISIEPPPVAPEVDVPESVGATELGITDLVDGDECQLAAAGDTVSLQLIAFRGDTGEELQSTWVSGGAIDVPLAEGTIEGIIDGVIGMGVGGRRQLVLPPALGFGADGNVAQGLEATTDVIIVVDLIAIR